MLPFFASLLLGAVQAPATPFAQVALRDFDAWDANRDGVLSVEEVGRAALDPQYHDEDAAALAALHTYLNADKQPPALSKGWFAAYQPVRPPATKELSPQERKQVRKAYLATPGSLQSSYVGDLRRLRKKGAPELYGEAGPQFTDIRQGQLGDCYFLAPLGAVAHRDPGAIRHMIAPSGDGYTVTFGDGRTVRVAGPTDAEIAMGGSSTAAGLWVRVMEKAYGSRDFAEGEGTSRIARDGMSGGHSGVVGRRLVGHTFTRIALVGGYQKPVSDADLAPKLARIRRDLPATLAAHRLALAGTSKADFPKSITPNHAYAVFGYDPATDVITLWNPHGDDFTPKGPEGFENGFRRVNGVFSMPLPLFARAFSGIAFEEPTLAAKE